MNLSAFAAERIEDKCQEVDKILSNLLFFAKSRIGSITLNQAPVSMEYWCVIPCSERTARGIDPLPTLLGGSDRPPKP